MPEEHWILPSAVGLLIASGLWLARSRRRPPLAAWAAVIATSWVWSQADQLNEGRILIVFNRDHGIVEADLLVPVVVGTALVLRRFQGAATHRAR